MSGLRFKVGDLARIAVTTKPQNLGKIVEIYAIGPWEFGDIAELPDGERIRINFRCDYFFAHSGPVGGRAWIDSDWRLQKLDPPTEPVEMTRAEERVAMT